MLGIPVSSVVVVEGLELLSGLPGVVLSVEVVGVHEVVPAVVDEVLVPVQSVQLVVEGRQVVLTGFLMCTLHPPTRQ